jgi:hypothetical protein
MTKVAVARRRGRGRALEDQRQRVRLDRWRALQDRFSDASLSVILLLEAFVIFFSGPLAAEGLPLAETIVDVLTWTVVTMMVLLSRRLGAIIAIFAGMTLMSTKFWPALNWPPAVATTLSGLGVALEFSALTWVVASAVFAPGRINAQRLQGAAVIYLNLALIFASAYRLIGDLNPSAFTNAGARDIGTMLYFSLTTLTTTGYGDVVAVDPFARGLANLEQVVGQFYLAITVARLIALQIADRKSEG